MSSLCLSVLSGRIGMEEWMPLGLYSTPQVKSLSLGFAYGESGSNNFSLNPGETKTCYMAALFSYVDNQRLASLGFFSNETKPEGFMLRRTKSTFLCEADTAFKALRKVSKRLFFRAQGGGEENQ